eukprot:m.74933 g.74933  ORF g.74933 m.74933 type:complete len:80 (-) comp13957_c1_seq1:1938-2177(-)
MKLLGTHSQACIDWGEGSVLDYAAVEAKKCGATSESQAGSIIQQLRMYRRFVSTSSLNNTQLGFGLTLNKADDGWMKVS